MAIRRQIGGSACWQDLLDFSDGYGNGESRPIYSDTDITAYYGW